MWYAVSYLFTFNLFLALDIRYLLQTACVWIRIFVLIANFGVFNPFIFNKSIDKEVSASAVFLFVSICLMSFLFLQSSIIAAFRIKQIFYRVLFPFPCHLTIFFSYGVSVFFQFTINIITNIVVSMNTNFKQYRKTWPK